MVVAGTESPSVKKVLTFSGRKMRSFGLTGAEDWYASDVTFAAECTRFRLNFRGRNLGVFESRMYGAHNLRNTLAALASCQEVGVDVEALRDRSAALLGREAAAGSRVTTRRASRS